jgi:eukaryotic-like serine/threonine-protein kinase
MAARLSLLPSGPPGETGLTDAGVGYTSRSMATGKHTTDRIAHGRYHLLSRIGRGGMGQVWRARDETLGREVAVKEVIFPDTPSDAERSAMRTRVIREARASARIAHPGVVTVYDVLQEEGRAYIVMELLQGRSLADRVKAEGPMEPREAARVGAELLHILRAAHAQGIVHRDVKPANVLLAETGEVKLADFGIASMRDEASITLTGQVFGSPHYMSPEQAAGARSGPATDLWGLGATLFYAVEGYLPFQGDHPLSVLNAVLHEDTPELRRAGPLAPVLGGLLRKDAEERVTDEEAARMLAEVAAGKATPPEATAPPEDAAALERPAAVAEREPLPVERAEQQPEPAPERPGGRSGWIVTLAVLLVLAVAAYVAASLLTRSEDPAGPGGRGGPSSTETQETVPSSWRTYEEETTGWTLAFPPSWRVEPQDETMIDFVDPQTGTYLRVDWGDDPGPSPVGAWRTLERSFSASHDDYQQVRLEPATYKGYEAAIWEFTFTEDGVDLHALDLGFVIGDEYGFALFFQTAAEDWEASRDLFERLQASFRPPD